MTEINLLPWREKRREQEKKQFTLYALIALILSISMVFGINYYALSLIQEQNERNQRLKDEIAQFDREIKEIAQFKALRQALIARMNIVQNLLATRTLTVRLFDEIIRIMPDGVYIYDIERTGDKVKLLGYTESNANISQLMRNIQSSIWIQDPVLTEIKKTEQKQQDRNEFNLSFVLKPKDTLGVLNHEPKLK